MLELLLQLLSRRNEFLRAHKVMNRMDQIRCIYCLIIYN